MLPNFDPRLRIPDEKQPSAYLTLMACSLARTQTVQLQLCELLAHLKQKEPKEVLDFYEGLYEDSLNELRIQIAKNFCE